MIHTPTHQWMALFYGKVCRVSTIECSDWRAVAVVVCWNKESWRIGVENRIIRAGGCRGTRVCV